MIRRLPITRAYRTLKRAQAGVAAIEFAFIAPVFFLILTSVISIYAQGTAQREVQQTTAALSDVASRYVFMDDERVTALGASAEALLQSTPSVSDIRLAVASFHNPQGANGFEYATLWSETYGGAATITDSEIQGALEQGNQDFGAHWLISTNDTMLFMRIEAKFESPYGIPGLNNEQTIVRNAWVLPRYTKSIEYREVEAAG